MLHLPSITIESHTATCRLQQLQYHPQRGSLPSTIRPGYCHKITLRNRKRCMVKSQLLASSISHAHIVKCDYGIISCWRLHWLCLSFRFPSRNSTDLFSPSSHPTRLRWFQPAGCRTRAAQTAPWHHWHAPRRYFP